MVLACAWHAASQLLFAVPVMIPAGCLGVVKARGALARRTAARRTRCA